MSSGKDLLDSVSLLQNASFWLGHAHTENQPDFRVSTWAEARQWVAQSQRDEIDRGIGRILTISMTFSRCQEAPDGLFLNFQLYLTADGELISEDRRLMRSLDQAVSWACSLRLTNPRIDPALRYVARLIAEFVTIKDGSIVPPPKAYAHS